ncbi:unnamed protein product [Caenorhabditis nigoni]
MECGDTKIKVSTIDYYHRDGFMNVFCGQLPNKLNENRKYFDDPSLPVPPVYLAKKFPDSGAGELYMESLLKYIRQNLWTLNKKPQFVTTRQLLSFIAAEGSKLIKVSAIRMNGIIYLFKTNDNTYSLHSSNFSENYRHFLTKSSENEEFQADGIVRKGVFMTEIPKDQNQGGSWKVLYSGVVPAIDDNMTHYEMKVYNFEKIRLLPRSEIPPTAAEAARNRIPVISDTDPDPRNPIWKVEDGEMKLQAFFHLVTEKLTNDGDEYVFFKPSGHIYWNTERCTDPYLVEILTLYGPTQLNSEFSPGDPQTANASQDFLFDEIQTLPNSKIYFNVPFNRSCLVRMTNVSMNSIAFKIASNHPDIKIVPESGSLGPHEFTMVEVKIDEFSTNYISSRIKIEWTDWIEGKSIDEIFEANGLFRKKNILVEFNE